MSIDVVLQLQPPPQPQPQPSQPPSQPLQATACSPQMVFSRHPSVLGWPMGSNVGSWLYVVLAHEFGNNCHLAFQADGVICGKLCVMEGNFVLMTLSPSDWIGLQLHKLLPRIFSSWATNSPPRHVERWLQCRDLQQAASPRCGTMVLCVPALL